MTEKPSPQELLEALSDGVLEPAKEPTVRKMDRGLHIFFGLVLFVLAGILGLLAGTSIILQLLGKLPRDHFVPWLVVACGGIGCAIIGIRLVFNIQGQPKYLFSPTMLWAFALFFSLFLIIVYVFLGVVIPPRPLLGALVIIGGCIVLAIRRGHGA